MEIRKLQTADYDSIYKLWLSCPGMGLNNLDDSREGIARYLARNPESGADGNDPHGDMKKENLVCGYFSKYAAMVFIRWD